MTTARIDWPTALSSGARIVPVILVAGVPRVLTPAGVRPTTVSVTSGTVDALWWPGTGTLTETLPDASTFDPVADLLDPREVFEVFERASLLKGDVRVEALTFSLLDTDGAATALLSVREGRTTQLLASDIGAADTSIPLGATTGFPTTGIAAIGRETITYGGIGGGSLTSATRGKYGSSARSHSAPTEHPPLVSAGGPRHWQSRLATLWLCVLSADGTTLTDPTLFYAGTVGAGVQLTGNLSRWSVPLDHVTESLSRKLDTAPIDLYGFGHYSTAPEAHPLRVGYSAAGFYAGDSLTLQWTGASDNGGWHPDLASFVRAADAVYSAGTSGSGRVQVDSEGKMVVRQQGSTASPRWFSASAAWDTAEVRDQRVDDDNTPAAWVSAARAPEACFRLHGWVKIPSAVDFARIPSTLQWTYTTTDGVLGAAQLSLITETRGGEVVATILERDATGQRVRVLPTTARDPLCVRRTSAKLGVVARGSSVVAALRAGALGIDALTGQDLYQSAVDWDDLERAFSGVATGGLPPAREYRFTADADSFLALLIDEMRLRGMCLAMRYGRITGVRLSSLADTESTVATIGESDLLTADGKELPVEVIDSTEPLATSVVFTIPHYDGRERKVSIVDTTFQGEFGDGAAVECKALMGVPVSVVIDVTSVLSSLYAVAQQVLGPLAEPSRAIRLPLTPALMGLQPGQLVTFTHSRIPSWTGTRGITAAVCQVQEVHRELMGGRFRATATIRLQSSVSAGYCPEVLIAAGGLNAASPIVTLDATTGWGAQCHAQDRDAAGDLSTDPSQGFAVGDKVVLSVVGDRTPISDEPFTIVTVTASTITLDGNPSAGMTAAAAGQYGVTLRWADYDTATTRQHTGFAWVADPAGTLGAGSDGGKRWAA